MVFNGCSREQSYICGITFRRLRDFPSCQSARLLTEPPEDFSISHEPFTLPDTLAPLEDLSRPVSATSERPLNDEPEDARSSTYLVVPETPMELPLDAFPVTEPAVIDSTRMLEPLEVENAMVVALAPSILSAEPLEASASMLSALILFTSILAPLDTEISISEPGISSPAAILMEEPELASRSSTPGEVTVTVMGLLTRRLVFMPQFSSPFFTVTSTSSMMLSGAVSVTDVSLPWVYSTLIPLEVSIEVTLSASIVIVFIGPASSTLPMVIFAIFSNTLDAAETQL